LDNFIHTAVVSREGATISSGQTVFGGFSVFAALKCLIEPLPAWRQVSVIGCLYRANGWPVNVEAWADLTGDPAPDRTIPSIVVTYTGGYTTIPSDLKKVCIDECLLAMSAPPDHRLMEEQTAGGWRRKWATGGTDSIISAKSKAALAGYRRIIYA